MPLLQWKPEYTVYERELDSHHQQLFELLNAAYESVMNSSEADCIKAVVNDLSECLKTHFAVEEQFMEGRGYQDVDAHIAEHRLFAHAIETLRMNRHDSHLEAAKELIVMLGNWVLRHILVEDRKYTEGVCMAEVNSTGV